MLKELDLSYTPDNMISDLSDLSVITGIIPGVEEFPVEDYLDLLSSPPQYDRLVILFGDLLSGNKLILSG